MEDTCRGDGARKLGASPISGDHDTAQILRHIAVGSDIASITYVRRVPSSDRARVLGAGENLNGSLDCIPLGFRSPGSAHVCQSLIDISSRKEVDSKADRRQ